MHIKISICTNAIFFSSVLPTLCCSFFLLTAYCMSDMWWWQNGWVLLLPWCVNIVQDVGDHSYCEWEKYLMWRNKEEKTTFWHDNLISFFLLFLFGSLSLAEMEWHFASCACGLCVLSPTIKQRCLKFIFWTCPFMLTMFNADFFSCFPCKK